MDLGKIDMGSDILNYYTAIAPSLRVHQPVAEVGIWLGRSLIHLARQLRKHHLGINLYGVDTFDGGPAATPAMQDFVVIHGGREGMFALAEDNLRDAGVDDMVTLINLPSAQAASRLAPVGPFSLVFIDASHTYEGTKEDILAWLPLIAKDGLLAGHDYDAPGVRQAVDELLPTAARPHNIWSWRNQ